MGEPPLVRPYASSFSSPAGSSGSLGTLPPQTPTSSAFCKVEPRLSHPRQPSLLSIGSLALCPSMDGTDFNSVFCMAVPLLYWELGRPLTGVPELAGQERTSTCRSPPPSLLPCCPLNPAWLSAMSHFTGGKTESQRRGVTCPGSHRESGSVFLSHVPEHRGGGGLLPSQGP